MVVYTNHNIHAYINTYIHAEADGLVLLEAVVDGDWRDKVWVQVVLDALRAADLNIRPTALRVAHKGHYHWVRLGQHVEVHEVAVQWSVVCRR